MNNDLVIAIKNGSIARLDSLGISWQEWYQRRWAWGALLNGRDARWWTSARLLFGLSEHEADCIANSPRLRGD